MLKIKVVYLCGVGIVKGQLFFSVDNNKTVAVGDIVYVFIEYYASSSDILSSVVCD